MAKDKKRPNLAEERRRRTKMDVLSTVIKDKQGKTVFDGRDLYRKKPKKEA